MLHNVHWYNKMLLVSKENRCKQKCIICSAIHIPLHISCKPILVVGRYSFSCMWKCHNKLFFCSFMVFSCGCVTVPVFRFSEKLYYTRKTIFYCRHIGFRMLYLIEFFLHTNSVFEFSSAISEMSTRSYLLFI